MKRVFVILWYAAEAMLLALFIYSIYKDYTIYYPYGSSPFYLYIIERFIEFIVPAIVLFIVGKRIIKKKDCYE